MKIMTIILLPFLLNFEVLFAGSGVYPGFSINGKNIKSYCYRGGDLFYYAPNPPLITGFEVPKGSGLSTIYVGQLWIGGTDSASGSLKVTAQTYRQSGGRSVWSPGPISTNSVGSIFEDVFPMYRSEANTHKNDFQQPGYVPDPLITTWPGNGSPSANELLDLAPFKDLNSNGLYEFAQGEYPTFYGKRNCFVVFNDQANNNTGPGMGIEVRGYSYELSEDGLDLDNVVFANYEFINRSANTYKDVYIGLFVDFDIGYSNDDFIGCDSARNAFFGYNGNNVDLNYFGNPPATAALILNRNLNSFVGYNNDADPKNGNPNTDLEYINYMRGKWMDGSSIKNVGDGKGTTGTDTKFLYSGNGWDEWALLNPIGDRRGVGGIGPIDLRPGERECLDLAFVYRRELNEDFLKARDSLRAQLDGIQRIWDSLNIGCNSNQVLAIPKPIKDLEIKLYPNPTKNMLWLDFENMSGVESKFQIFNLMGQTVYEKSGLFSGKIPIDIEHIPTGSYLIKVSNKQGSQTIRFSKM